MIDALMENNILKERRENFIFQLKLSETVKRNYINALSSSFLIYTLADLCNKTSIFEITNLEELWKLYSYINVHPKNIAHHRVYSAAIMKYIRFLNNGKKYGRRIDYNKKKGKRSSL